MDVYDFNSSIILHSTYRLYSVYRNIMQNNKWFHSPFIHFHTKIKLIVFQHLNPCIVWLLLLLFYNCRDFLYRFIQMLKPTATPYHFVFRQFKLKWKNKIIQKTNFTMEFSRLKTYKNDIEVCGFEWVLGWMVGNWQNTTATIVWQFRWETEYYVYHNNELNENKSDEEADNVRETSNARYRCSLCCTSLNIIICTQYNKRDSVLIGIIKIIRCTEISFHFRFLLYWHLLSFEYNSNLRLQMTFFWETAGMQTMFVVIFSI